MFWMKQTLDEVAYNTARCMSVSSECGTTANQKNHAVQRAAGYGLAINLENVEIVPNAPCKGYPGSNSVTVSMAFNSPASGLLPLPAVLQAHACYPVLS